MAVRIFRPLRCQLCRWMRLQSYQIDFEPYQYDGYRFPRQPVYSCHRCLPSYQSDSRVVRVIRLLSESEVAT
jgi:hypothetical protein